MRAGIVHDHRWEMYHANVFRLAVYFQCCSRSFGQRVTAGLRASSLRNACGGNSDAQHSAVPDWKPKRQACRAGRRIAYSKARDREVSSAVILIHGSGGIGAAHARWVDELNSVGVATFLVDSFSGRCIVNTITDQSQLDTLPMMVDAWHWWRNTPELMLDVSRSWASPKEQ